jgi:hypothetical protein
MWGNTSPDHHSTCHMNESPQPPCNSTGTAPSEGLMVKITHSKLQSLTKDSITFCLLCTFLTHVPTVEGVSVIARDIIEASAVQDGLDQLVKFYITGLLLPSKFVLAPVLDSQSIYMVESES